MKKQLSMSKTMHKELTWLDKVQKNFQYKEESMNDMLREIYEGVDLSAALNMPTTTVTLSGGGNGVYYPQPIMATDAFGNVTITSDSAYPPTSAGYMGQTISLSGTNYILTGGGNWEPV